jgi:hypothetical protein
MSRTKKRSGRGERPSGTTTSEVPLDRRLALVHAALAAVAFALSAYLTYTHF